MESICRSKNGRKMNPPSRWSPSAEAKKMEERWTHLRGGVHLQKQKWKKDVPTLEVESICRSKKNGGKMNSTLEVESICRSKNGRKMDPPWRWSPSAEAKMEERWTHLGGGAHLQKQIFIEKIIKKYVIYQTVNTKLNKK